MNLSERCRVAIVLAAFAAAFVTLTVTSYVRASATWDEPQHLTAGYAALVRQDYRIDPEHPPLARMWAALPVALSRSVNFQAESPYWQDGPPWFFCHDFLYRDNDADRLLYRARFMIVLLGVLLGGLVFAWCHELFGFGPATIVLALFCLEPNLLAHSSLVTTDLAVTCLAFGTFYFLWRLTRRWNAGNLTGLVACFVLAQLTKYTAVLLGPIVLVLLGLHAWRTRRPWRALTVVGGLAAASYLGIWAVYGFRYEPTPEPAPRFGLAFDRDPRVQQAAPVVAAVTRWVTARRLLPKAYAEGFLLTHAKSKTRPGYFGGRYSPSGWWYYFPVAFLIKTPLTVVVLVCAGLAVYLARWRRLADDGLCVLVPIGVFFGSAMIAHINIGLRHVLPAYPFLLVLAGGAVAVLWTSRWRWVTVVVAGLAAAELALIHPHYLAAFNLAVGGPRHGDEYLVDSNIDWGQGLKGLKQWMDRQGVAHVNLSYFGTADPAYYGIRATYLPGSPFFAEPLVGAPLLPGYVAVSLTNLRARPFAEAGWGSYEALRDRPPVARIGHSIQVYRVDERWW